MASGDSIDLPPGSLVTMQQHSAAVVLRNNVRGTLNCSCSGGKGSCTVDVGEGMLMCNAPKVGGCAGSCRFSSKPSTFGAAVTAASAHAASESHIPQ
jgi:hypothetical protein